MPSPLVQKISALILGLSALPASAYEYSLAVDALNPVGYWQLGDIDSTVAVDSAGGNDGTYNGNYSLGNPGPFASQGDTNGSLDTWNGSHGYVEIGHDSDYLLNEGTYSLWFLDDGGIGNYSGLFSKDSSGYDTGGHLTMFTRSDGRVEVRMQSTSSSFSVQSDASSFSLDEWVHVAFTFGLDGMNLYIDGNLVDSNSYTGGMSGNYEPIVLGAHSIYSGNHTIHGLGGYFSGLLDEFAIFDVALSAEQITALYEGSVPGGGGGGGPSIPVPPTLFMLSLGLGLLYRKTYC